MPEISYHNMGVQTHIIDGRLCIDSTDLINHLARYFNVVADDAERLRLPELGIAAEAIRQLAFLLLEAHDLTIAGDSEMFQKELDNLFTID